MAGIIQVFRQFKSCFWASVTFSFVKTFIGDCYTFLIGTLFIYFTNWTSKFGTPSTAGSAFAFFVFLGSLDTASSSLCWALGCCTVLKSNYNSQSRQCKRRLCSSISPAFSSMIDDPRKLYKTFLSSINRALDSTSERPGIPCESCCTCVLVRTVIPISSLWPWTAYFFALATKHKPVARSKHLVLPYSVQVALVMQGPVVTSTSFSAYQQPLVLLHWVGIVKVLLFLVLGRETHQS